MSRRYENMTELEKEARSVRFVAMLKRELGCACHNCGSTEMVEYHHVVPLALGGTNRLTNIRALCYKCHKTTHTGRHISSFADHSHSHDGRPPKCDDEVAFNALELMLGGEIGNKRCQELMGLKDGTRPCQTGQARKYRDKHGIRKFRSNLDVALTNSPWTVCEGRPVGEVEYVDGRRETILFHDTGANDSTVYSFCRRGELRGAEKETMTWGEHKKLLTDEFSSDIDRRRLRRQAMEYAWEASAVYGDRVRDPQVSETPCAS